MDNTDNINISSSPQQPVIQPVPLTPSETQIPNNKPIKQSKLLSALLVYMVIQGVTSLYNYTLGAANIMQQVHVIPF